MPASPTDIPRLHDHPTLTVCIGLPGSGKTYWAGQQLHKAFCEGHTSRLWRSNRDDYRRMMLAPSYGRPPVAEIENIITTIQYQQMHLLLSGGADVICDDTNLNPLYLENLLKLAGTAGALVVAQDFTAVPLDVCIQRDFWRAAGTGYVGATVIKDMHERWIAPHGDDLHPCVKMIRATGGLLVGEHHT